MGNPIFPVELICSGARHRSPGGVWPSVSLQPSVEAKARKHSSDKRMLISCYLVLVVLSVLELNRREVMVALCDSARRY